MEKSLRGIFQNGYEDFHRSHGVGGDQHTAAHAIMTCCTDETGMTEWICPQDDTSVTERHCCRHRNCPRWLGILRDIAKRDWNVRIQGAYRHGQVKGERPE